MRRAPGGAKYDSRGREPAVFEVLRQGAPAGGDRNLDRLCRPGWGSCSLTPAIRGLTPAAKICRPSGAHCNSD